MIGASGAVGVELLRCLQERNFPLSRLRLFGSERSAGKRLSFADEQLTIEELRADTLDDIDLALFSAGSSVSKRFAPLLAARGAIVIDNSSAFRMERNVPLVVPEINGEQLASHAGIIANPNCAAIISLLAVWPIHRAHPLRRLILSTYQAASGAGAAAMDELVASTRAHLEGVAYEPKVLPHPYAFNVFSHNTRVDSESGYTEEELKVIAESKKILRAPELGVSATCIRVPVLRAHCVSITLECGETVSPERVRELLSRADGVKLVDDRKRNHFPMPRVATGIGPVLVGRIRRDLSDPSGRSVSLFAAGDQLLKGAALNAVQIAERLLPAS